MAKAGLLFVGTADGVVLFSNPNEIGRWLRVGQAFRGAAVPAVWAAPENPLLVFAAVEGQGVQRSDDGGQGWQPLFDWPAETLAGASTGPIAICGVEQLAVSGDRGLRWAMQPLAGAGGPVVANTGQLYVAAGRQVWRGSDAEQALVPYGEPLPAAATGLAAALQVPRVLYASANGAFFVCTAADAAWAQQAAPANRGPLLALAGRAPALLMARAEGGIARSDDGGVTWTTALAEGEVQAITAVSYHVDEAYAGTADGQLLHSADRGRSWQAVKSGLPPIVSLSVARLI